MKIFNQIRQTLMFNNCIPTNVFSGEGLQYFTKLTNKIKTPITKTVKPHLFFIYYCYSPLPTAQRANAIYLHTDV